jgi:Ni,Fe-hydrogenase I large subunit
MSIEGELTVRVGLRGNGVAAVEVASTRPQLAQKLLAGQSAEEALARVPRLFSICGRSQAVAAQLALAAAQGEALDAAALAAQSRAVEAEIAQEYLWRALIDWPRATGRAPATEALAAARAAAQGEAPATALRAVVEAEVLGEACEQWLDSHVPGFEIWIARSRTAAAAHLAQVQRDGPRHGAGDVPLLPSCALPATLTALADGLERDPQFDRAPQLDGKPAETGALARLRRQPLVEALLKVYGNSVLTRLVARVTELARTVAGRPSYVPLVGQRALGPARGLGWVETARGLLLHLVELNGEQVTGYRIVAPTEWNFHPRGALAAGLLGSHMLDAAEARRRTEWLVQALDPCVRCTVEVAHA